MMSEGGENSDNNPSKNDDNSILLQVDDQEFHVSKSRLVSISDYFRAMLQGSFREAQRKTIQLTEIDSQSVHLILQWSDDPANFDWSRVPHGEIEELWRTASFLLVEQLKEQLLNYLEQQLCPQTALWTWQTAAALSLEVMAGKARSLSLWEFEEANSSLQLRNLSMQQLLDLFTDEQLCVDADVKIYEYFMDWCAHATNKVSLEEQQAALLTLLQVHRSHLGHGKEECPRSPESLEPPVTSLEHQLRDELQHSCIRSEVACVVGMPAPVLQGGRLVKSNQMTAAIYAFSMFRDPEQLLDLDILALPEDQSTEEYGILPVGFQVSCNGKELVVSGGEYKYGTSCWNNIVWKYDLKSKVWRELCRLTEPRRHHSAIILGPWIYLLGGFGKFRRKLISMIRIHLETGTEEACEPMLHHAANFAATYYKEEICVMIERSLYFYNPARDSWSSRPVSGHPEKGPSFCLAHRAGTRILLTARYSRDVYSLNPETGAMQLAGRLSAEGQSACVAGPHLVSFASEEFGEEGRVELLSLTSGRLTTLWQQQAPAIRFDATAGSASAFAVPRRCLR